MAATASISITGTIQGTPGGGIQVGPLTITSAAANWQVQQIALANGANTITVPTTPAPTGVIIIFAATANIHTLKGVAGDAGIALGKGTIQLLTWDPTAPPASFVVNAGAADTAADSEFIFF
jgi:hypothetical protein